MDLRAQLYEARRAQSGPGGLATLRAGSALALALVQLERDEYAKAEPLLATLVPQWHALGSSAWRTAKAENLWGSALVAQGRTTECGARRDAADRDAARR